MPAAGRYLRTSLYSVRILPTIGQTSVRFLRRTDACCANAPGVSRGPVARYRVSGYALNMPKQQRIAAQIAEQLALVRES